ncbi:MAG: hypothetical protein K8R53_14215 [Bacteroidales bacterium]|nr:hypothetical protein [Bacteroidales bacterium]
MKRVIKIGAVLIILAGFVLLLSFISAEQKKTVCRNLDITIEQPEKVRIISEDEIRMFIHKHFDTLPGRKISDIDLNLLENSLQEIDFVENADVFKSFHGDIEVRIVQCNPILRIIGSNRENVYFDEAGKVIIPDKTPAVRLIVAHGNIDCLTDKTKKLNKWEDSAMPRNNSCSIFEGLYNMALVIHSDPFMKAMIDQIYINKNSEIELVPKVGSQMILFGNLEDIYRKFKKLEVFYLNGLPKSGWGKYKKIDLKYENQVVCLKK